MGFLDWLFESEDDDSVSDNDTQIETGQLYHCHVCGYKMTRSEWDRVSKCPGCHRDRSA